MHANLLSPRDIEAQQAAANILLPSLIVEALPPKLAAQARRPTRRFDVEARRHCRGMA